MQRLPKVCISDENSRFQRHCLSAASRPLQKRLFDRSAGAAWMLTLSPSSPVRHSKSLQPVSIAGLKRPPAWRASFLSAVSEAASPDSTMVPFAPIPRGLREEQTINSCQPNQRRAGQFADILLSPELHASPVQGNLFRPLSCPALHFLFFFIHSFNQELSTPCL